MSPVPESPTPARNGGSASHHNMMSPAPESVVPAGSTSRAGSEPSHVRAQWYWFGFTLIEYKSSMPGRDNTTTKISTSPTRKHITRKNALITSVCIRI